MQISANSPEHLIAQWRAVSAQPWHSEYDPMSYVMCELGKQAKRKVKKPITVPRVIKQNGAKIEDGCHLGKYDLAEVRRIEREWDSTEERNKRADKKAFMNPEYSPTDVPKNTKAVCVSVDLDYELNKHRDFIIKEYTAGISTKQIGEALGFPGITIWRWCKKHKINNITPWQHLHNNRGRIIEMKSKGYQNSEIAKELGVPKSRLTNWLSAQGITKASIKAGKV